MKTISQPTRNAARKLVSDLKLSGKKASILDKGSDLKWNDRWFVLVESSSLQGTLKAPVKPSKRDPRKVIQLVKNAGFNALRKAEGKVMVYIKTNKLHCINSNLLSV